MLLDTNNIIVSYGTNCKQSDHHLISLDISEIYEHIRESEEGLISQTKILRSIRKYDKDRYRMMKTSLPFFSCSTFEPDTRKIDHFRIAAGLIIDIDWKVQLNKDVYNNIIQDPRVLMAYISPSGIGAKVIFAFDSPMDDAHTYSQVYKAFAHQFAHTYGIDDVVDYKNSDVSRISFLCYDPEAFINLDAIPIEWSSYARPVELELRTDNRQQEIAPDVYKSIMQKLNSKPQIVKNKIKIQEPILRIIPFIKKELEIYDIHIIEEEGMQYGVKLKLQLAKDLGEVNIYYGKRGYTVVSSPKKGTYAELNELSKHIINSILPIGLQ